MPWLLFLDDESSFLHSPRMNFHTLGTHSHILLLWVEKRNIECIQYIRLIVSTARKIYGCAVWFWFFCSRAHYFSGAWTLNFSCSRDWAANTTCSYYKLQINLLCARSLLRQRKKKDFSCAHFLFACTLNGNTLYRLKFCSFPYLRDTHRKTVGTRKGKSSQTVQKSWWQTSVLILSMWKFMCTACAWAKM